MIHYRDMTFCVSPECKDKCGRKLTPEIKAAAKRWWLTWTKDPDEGGPPIACAEFCDEKGEVKP